MMTRGLVCAVAGLRAAGVVAALSGAVFLAPVAVGPLDTAAAARADFRLEPGEVLRAGDSLTSPDGRYVLTQQVDGNLVLRGPGGTPLFNTITAGHPGASTTMQYDGNLVVHNRAGKAIFHTNTHDNEGAFLQVQTDGNLVIYQDDDEALWSRHAWYGLLPSKFTLAPNDYVRNRDNACRLVMQADGNLVLQGRNDETLFQTGTHGYPGARAAMQSDGNFVVRAKGGGVLFDTATAGNPGANLQVQPDCNVVVRSRDGNKPLFDTRTSRD
jgi:hypothetical protein